MPQSRRSVHTIHHPQRELETAICSAILAAVCWFCRNSIISHAASMKREYEPGATTFLWVCGTALIGAIRFGFMPRIPFIRGLHQFLSVVIPQIGISLLGLFYMSCAFPNSWLVTSLTRNDQKMFGIRRTLLIVCLFMYVMNIRHVDLIVPIMAHTPIIITCLMHFRQPDILMPALLATAFLFVSSFLIGGSATTAAPPSSSATTGGPHLFGIPHMAWFYVGLACGMFCHHVALVNLLLESPKPFMTFVTMLIRLAPT